MAVVAVVACTGGIESLEKFAEGTASPCHGELIVFSLFLLASVNELRKGKDAAAERLCSTVCPFVKLPGSPT